MLNENNLLLTNIKNYGIYQDLVYNGYMTIYTKDINKDNHFSPFHCQ